MKKRTKPDRKLFESFRRPTENRSPRKAILISLEDTKSARYYFESFRRELELSRVIVIAEHIGTDPKNVIVAAKREVERRDKQVKDGEEDAPFDEVWVVFDLEGPMHPRRRMVRSAIAQAKELNYKTAVSNPSFEYWYLLHFTYYVGSIADGGRCCHLLNKYLRKYHKARDYYKETRPRLPEAISNAKRAFTERGIEGEATHPCDCHPSTEVYRLIGSLLGEA